MDVNVGSMVQPLPEVEAFIARRHGLFIGGKWCDSTGGRIDVHNPATAAVITSVALASAAEVDAAVRSAADAFKDGRWSGLPPVLREKTLLRFADLVESHGEALAQIETINQGKSINISRFLDVGFSAGLIRYTAGLTTKLTGQSMEVSIPIPPGARYTAYTRREPVGVVAAIAPWNFPLMIALWKIMPALAAGCTVVLKPSEVTPLTALRLAEIAVEAGIPAGVLNVVTGDGATTGAALAGHPAVAKISFTGSTATGRKLGHVAIDRMARFTLELGGKNPAIFLADTPVEKAVGGALLGGFLNSGQVCASASRLYVQRPIFSRFVEALTAAVAGMSVGPGLDPNAQVNPVVSATHLARITRHVAQAKADGVKIAAGGMALPGPGYFFAPTVIIEAAQGLAICRDEVFGPVVTVTPFDTVDEAVTMANDTDLGLTASIWSNDLEQTMAMIPRLQAGTVWVNSHNVLDANMPFGGYKQSGMGRDFGTGYLDAFTEVKSVCIAY